MNTSTPFKITIGIALLTYAGFMAAAIHEGAKLRKDPSVDLSQLQTEEKMSDIKLQLTEAQLDTDALILDDMLQAHFRGMKHPRDALRCLTDNIYYEAGTEPFEGKVAVAQVVMNRVSDSYGGDTVCDVVYFKKISPITGKIQAAFSWTLGRAWRARGPIDWKLWRECRDIARKVLAGKLHSDLIGPDVEYYHADYMTPSWVDNHTFVAKIGTQDFYQ